MHASLQHFLALALIFTLAACGPSPAPSEPVTDAPLATAANLQPLTKITGTVSYRERMALTPTAQLNIQLQDISLADVAATIIAEKTVSNVGQVPINFELEYDPALIEARNTYTVRAVIRDGGQMLFTTDTVYPVITRGNASNAEMLLIRAASGALPATAELADTYWKLSGINGTPIVTPDDQRAPYLRFMTEGNVAQGFSGCNQFSGNWKITDGRIALGPMAMTMMACADGMDTEQSFMQALATMDRHEIQGDELRIFQNNKEVLLLKATTEP